MNFNEWINEEMTKLKEVNERLENLKKEEAEWRQREDLNEREWEYLKSLQQYRKATEEEIKAIKEMIVTLKETKEEREE